MTITRVQRKRTKGFRLPPDTVCVSRPGKLGNPFNWTDWKTSMGETAAKQFSVDLFRRCVEQPLDYPGLVFPTREAIRVALAGKRHVACFCRLDEPCHGDVLIAIATTV